ncbi:MAG: hypothetical protein JO171_02825 [Paludibacterium sp.]|uniref:hypothetical protein n=1 Tax=Paludibacterium sp. TaxID=1917523 RepID=UPI0025EA4AA9|nr:hypothetical protein [Paludibacterium sp.]MBV8046059.1 hypothetical protein [Paludibacterium sp.]MBV8646148.1 hypothetical protein [Paludibacterium sp.]
MTYTPESTQRELALQSQQAQAELTEQMQRAQQLQQQIHQLEARAQNDPKARDALQTLSQVVQTAWQEAEPRLRLQLARLERYVQSQPPAVIEEALTLPSPSTAAVPKTSASAIRRSFL